MDLTVSVRDGWALLTETDTGRTALALPTVTPERIVFDVQGWHDTYEDAYLVVAAMDAAGVTIHDIIGSRIEDAEEDAAQIGPAPPTD